MESDDLLLTNISDLLKRGSKRQLEFKDFGSLENRLGESFKVFSIIWKNECERDNQNRSLWVPILCLNGNFILMILIIAC